MVGAWSFGTLWLRESNDDLRGALAIQRPNACCIFAESALIAFRLRGNIFRSKNASFRPSQWTPMAISDLLWCKKGTFEREVVERHCRYYL